MQYEFGKKFTDINLDEFLDKVYNNHKTKNQDSYIFDLTEVEFIGNQELLVFSALLKSFVGAKIKFQVVFFKPGVPTIKINTRVKKQIIEVWSVWQIYKIIPSQDYIPYFGIDGNTVNRLMADIEYYPKAAEIYTWHGITPFISLDYINNYTEKEVKNTIKPIYRLNQAIEELLELNNCYHPFTSNSLSTIITEELYLNFLDHSQSSAFNGFYNSAFFSVSFQNKTDEKKKTFGEIQSIKELNFKTEHLNETLNFFYDQLNKRYYNRPYIQFSFLDFGKGIPTTLRDQYQIFKQSDKEVTDSKVLSFAFEHYSSRHPIEDGNHSINKLVPRGLFDALTIVRRYRGLLIARSNYGKTVLDFSEETNFEKALISFGNQALFFPGTLITIYIPAIEEVSKINISTIKPDFNFTKINTEAKVYISVSAVADKLSKTKENLYSSLIKELQAQISSNSEPSIIYISFMGCESVDKRIIKKALYFLCTDYNINLRNNIVILNGPPQPIINELNEELNLLSSAIKNYKLHPLPIVNYDRLKKKIDLQWFGVFNEEDKSKLSELLFCDYSLAKSDFIEPNNVIGHLNSFDAYGNLQSNFPDLDKLYQLFHDADRNVASLEITRLLEKHDCIKDGSGKELFLCQGNYYQEKFIELTNLVNDPIDCRIVSKRLYDLISSKTESGNNKFIGISATSQKILKSLEEQNVISCDDYLTLDDDITFNPEFNLDNIQKGCSYVLVCDVISTGHLTKRLQGKLNDLGAQLDYVAVLVSTLSPKYDQSKEFLKEFGDKVISLTTIEIEKLKINRYNSPLNKEVVRINPHTNIPITLSIHGTNYDETVIFDTNINYIKDNNEILISNPFLDLIDSSDIKVGFLNFNNLIHPYFFNTSEILKNITIQQLLQIFKKINKPELYTDSLEIFYPRKSGIEKLDFALLKQALLNHAVGSTVIERFGTPEGWRFPHNSNYLVSRTDAKICFLLDDGSCTGDSLIQMIDEIAFYNPKEIILLCIIGRVDDHKREFFSRISHVKVKDNKSVKISIFFATHWHIPTYYLDNNPITNEKLWLNDLIGLHNTPLVIKNIASNIINEISSKSINKFKDYKYLPKERSSDGKSIPKKDLLLVRNEIGKIIGYRLYKQSFTYFNYFILKYNNRINSKDRYKEMELLCANFIYEPYLYQKIELILPDVIEKIEDFVRVLIFNKSDIFNRLTYEWDKKDIVHLFFVVFKDQKLVTELNADRFKQLIAFTKPKEVALNYVLYKLLFYFPLRADQLRNKKFDIPIKNLIYDLKNTTDLKEIKKYYNYISTLPSRDDFESQIALLRQNYDKQKEPELHDNRASFNHNVSKVIALLRESIIDIEEGKHIDSNSISTVAECWFDMLIFINPILSFSSSFPDFLKPYPYFRLVNKVDGSGDDISLREMVGFNEDVLYDLRESFKDVIRIHNFIEHTVKIQTIVKVNSTLHGIIKSPKGHLNDFLKPFLDGLKELGFNIKANIAAYDREGTVSIPKDYIEILIKTELLNNIKHHALKDVERYIQIEGVNNGDGSFTISIDNFITKDDYKNSNGEGIKCLKLIADSPLFGFNYTFRTEGTHFQQFLTFNLI